VTAPCVAVTITEQWEFTKGIMTDLNPELQHYLTTWNLSNPQPLAQTPTSHVYTVTHDQTVVVLKILTDYGVEERIGALALRHFQGNGAVRLLHSDDGAQLLEYANGKDVTELVRNGQDETATAVIAEVVNALHANDAAPPEGMTSLRTWFRALFAQAEQDHKEGLNTILRHAATIADTVFAQPHKPRVLHGDIHHANIRQSARGWLAFDPKGLYGERTYDLANTLCNPVPVYGAAIVDEGRILRNSGILAQKCSIERARVLLFLYLYACLTASWTLEGSETGWEVDTILKIAAIAERHMERI
jgi:streptomycin 6-kinase